MVALRVVLGAVALALFQCALAFPSGFILHGNGGDQVPQQVGSWGDDFIQGTVQYPPSVSKDDVFVRVFRLHVDSEGQPIPLSKRDFFGVDNNGRMPGFMTIPLHKASDSANGSQGDQTNDDNYWDFQFPRLPEGYYAMMAFEDRSGHGNLTFVETETHEGASTSNALMMGWYATEGCVGRTPGADVCMDVINVADDGGVYYPHSIPKPSSFFPATIYLTSPTPFPTSVHEVKLEGGSGRFQPPHLLQLEGTPFARGYAHGYLLRDQIMDMIDLFLLEDRARNITEYEELLVPQFKNFKMTPDFEGQIHGMIEGMASSESGRGLFSNALRRNITYIDLLALNGYGEIHSLLQAYEHKRDEPVQSAAECTQFVVWDEEGKKGDGVIAGRNMDGEIDVRKVTTGHFLIVAVDPKSSDRLESATLRKYVHFMWPGFVGTSSGINEDGRWVMQNSGCSPPGPPPDEMYLERDAIRGLLQENPTNSPLTPKTLQHRMDEFASNDGGPCTAGCIFVVAERDAADNGNLEQSDEHGDNRGMVFEGDRFGGHVRTSEDVRPTAPNNIMASNHFWGYKMDEDAIKRNQVQTTCNGIPISFSSQWRYEAPRNHIEAWARNGRYVGVEEMKTLLRIATMGATEHSVIYSPGNGAGDPINIFVAVARLGTQPGFKHEGAADIDVWDAPYREWDHYEFDQLFEGL